MQVGVTAPNIGLFIVFITIHKYHNNNHVMSTTDDRIKLLFSVALLSSHY